MKFAKVYLEITNVCNMSCSFCAGTDREKKFMSVDEFCLLAKKIRPYTDFLYFHLMGEPTVHPELERFLDISSQLEFKVIITTNGTLLGKVSSILIKSKALFKVNISLHCFEANIGILQDKYFKECFDFADKISRNDVTCVFRLWNEGGFCDFNDSIISMLKKRFEGEWVTNTRGIRIRKKLFIENGEKFDWPGHSDTCSERVICYGLKDHIGVLCDGSVVPCCLDYNGTLCLGNLFESELDDILTSRAAIKFRQDLDKQISPSELCSRCGFAQKRFLHLN